MAASTDANEIKRLLAQFEDENREDKDRHDRLGRKIAGRIQAIQGLRMMLKALGDDDEGENDQSGVAQESPVEVSRTVETADYPRGAEAVYRVLLATGREMTIREITNDLLSRGWVPRSKNPENATSSNAARALEVYPDVAKRRGSNGSVVYRRVAPNEGVSNITDMVRRVAAVAGQVDTPRISDIASAAAAANLAGSGIIPAVEAAADKVSGGRGQGVVP